MTISKPFYIKTRDCPQKTSTSKICKACEKISGTKSMKAAMWNKNVWILNANSEEARVFLLGAGSINIDGAMVRLYGDHPFITIDKDGNKIPSTKLVIDGIPIDVDGDIITRYLSSIGINTRSKLNFENAWDQETKSLSEWLTGKRFIYIDLPQNELKKTYKMGEYEMKLHYKEMEKETPRCKRCFGPHWTNTCRDEERCLSCKLPGHRRGDPTCPKAIRDFEDDENDVIDNGRRVEKTYDSDNYISADEAEDKREEEEHTIDDNLKSSNDGYSQDDAPIGERNGETGEETEENKDVTSGYNKDNENAKASETIDDKKDEASASPEDSSKIKGVLKPTENRVENKKDVNSGNEKQEKSKTGKEDKGTKERAKTKETKADRVPMSKQNGQKQAPPGQDRGRAQEKLDRYVQRQDRSGSKRRASKSPNNSSQENKLRRKSSIVHVHGHIKK